MRGRLSAAVAIVLTLAALVGGLVVVVPICCDDGAQAEVETVDADIEGHPGGLVVAPGGRLFYTEQFDDRIGWFDPEPGEGESIEVPQGTLPHYLIVGPDENIWFTDLGGVVGTYDVEAEEVELFRNGTLLPTETQGEELNTLASSADDSKIVFNMFQSGRIGVLDLESGEVTEIGQELESTSGPIEVIRAPDGTLYCTLVSLSDEPGSIVRIDVEEEE